MYDLAVAKRRGWRQENEALELLKEKKIPIGNNQDLSSSDLKSQSFFSYSWYSNITFLII